jgi:hypothetical protein
MNERPDALLRSIEAAKSLRLELARLLTLDGLEMSADDLQAMQDTFDGETSLDVEIRNAVLAIEEDEIFVRGIKARETELKDRRSRLEKRIETTRGLIEQAMTIAKWQKHEMDIGTVSLNKAAPRVEIDQESEVPSQFWKRQDPTLDKAGLGKVLKERQKKLDEIAKLKPDQREAALAALGVEMPAIPGAHLEVGGFNLTIRRS